MPQFLRRFCTHYFYYLKCLSSPLVRRLSDPLPPENVFSKEKKHACIPPPVRHSIVAYELFQFRSGSKNVDPPYIYYRSPPYPQQ